MYHIYHIFCISGSVCHIYLICHIWRCSMLSAMWHICPCLCQVPYPVDLPYLLIFPCQVPSAMYSIYLICRFCPLWSCVRPNQARASLLLCDFKAPTEFSSSKKSNLLSGRFLEIRKLRGRPSSPPKGKTTWCWLTWSRGAENFPENVQTWTASQNVGLDMPWGNEGMSGEDEGGYLGEWPGVRF